MQNKNVRAPYVLEVVVHIKTGFAVQTTFIVHLVKNIVDQKMLPKSWLAWLPGKVGFPWIWIILPYFMLGFSGCVNNRPILYHHELNKLLSLIDNLHWITNSNWNSLNLLNRIFLNASFNSYRKGPSIIASVQLWKFKDGGSLKARFLQYGDQVSRMDFIWFFEMEEHGVSEASNYNWS